MGEFDYRRSIQGHRQRLKDRFYKGGIEAVADYELLELVLFSALPRRDIKLLAKALIETFGNFSEVISAQPERLQEISGMGRNAVITLKIIEAAAQKLAQEKILDKPVLAGWQSLLDYCQIKMAHKKKEQLRILYLDRTNRLIADEMQQEGTIDRTPVYPREVIKRALELNATAIILAHNHPSGDPTPSRDDIDMTKQIQKAGDILGITLHDHLIVAKTGQVSFKNLGLI